MDDELLDLANKDDKVIGTILRSEYNKLVEGKRGYIASALREAGEEIGLTLHAEDLQFIHKFPPARLPYFRSFYLYKSDETPMLNPDDFVSAAWLTPQEIQAKLDSGVPAKDSLRETIAFILAR